MIKLTINERCIKNDRNQVLFTSKSLKLKFAFNMQILFDATQVRIRSQFSHEKFSIYIFYLKMNRKMFSFFFFR